MLFKLVFVNKTILSCFFFFFLIIDLNFLISAAFTQVFNTIAEIVMAIGKRTKEAKAEIETHPVTAKDKISVQYNLKPYKLFLCFLSF